MTRSFGTPLALSLALALIAASCSSDDGSKGAGGAGEAGASGSGGKGSGGSAQEGGSGSKGGTSDGGSSGDAGATGTGGTGRSGQGGEDASGGEPSGGQAGQGGSSGGAPPYIPDIACSTDEDCNAPCQAHGWPEGRCQGVESPYCICRSVDEPTCEVKSTNGCPPGMHCRLPRVCLPIGDAGPGEPCPNGDECPLGYVCVGYGNPLPSGASTACREICDAQSPPPGCNCVGGFCTNSGEGGEGGAGGAGGSCGDDLDACSADADPTNIEFRSGKFGLCAKWNEPGDGTGWVIYGSSANTGFSYDVETGLAWAIRTTSGTMDHASAAAFCESLEVAGLDDWRLPTIDEARTLAAGCPDTEPGGSCPLSDSCLAMSCNDSMLCTSCVADQGPHEPGGDYCRPEINICSAGHTTSLCSDCATSSSWRYSPINGNFYANALTNLAFPVCVMEGVDGLPCLDPTP